MGRLNPKHTTMLQRLGFQDQDLTTAAHDEIIFWLSNKDELLGILKKLIPVPTWNQQKVDGLRDSATAIVASRIQRLEKDRATAQGPLDLSAGKEPRTRYSAKQLAGCTASVQTLTREIDRLRALEQLPVPPDPELQIDEMIIEYPLRTNVERNPMIVGYADLCVRCSVPRSLEVAGGANEASYVSEADRWRDPRWFVEHGTTAVLFEVKSEIRSFGELMRQLQTYRTYFGGIIVVVCPDGRFAEQLEAQGIRFVKPPATRAPSGPRQGELL